MKINWGTKMVFFAVLFMLFIVTLVLVISKQDVALVDDNYYEKGLNYQKEIDNNKKMDSTISLEINQFGEEKALLVMKSSEGDILDARIKYYRPSNPKMDQQFKTQILSGKRSKHSLKGLEPGIWKVALLWNEGDEEFKIEKEFER
jgi:hypothetical protein